MVENSNDEWNPALVNHRLKELEAARRDSTLAFAALSDALSSIKVMQAESHADRAALGGTIERAMTTMAGIETRTSAANVLLEERVRKVEEGLPVFKVISKYVILGVAAAVGLLLTAMANLALNTNYHKLDAQAQKHIVEELEQHESR